MFMNPPPIRGPLGTPSPISREDAARAIETAREALPLLSTGPPIVRMGPAGEVHVDIPLLYQGYALDRIHFDPSTMEPSPKGRPVVFIGSVDRDAVNSRANEILGELRVLDAAEYREPERCWVIPLAWGPYLVAHIKVSNDGRELVPDYGLTEEVRRYVY